MMAAAVAAAATPGGVRAAAATDCTTVQSAAIFSTGTDNGDERGQWIRNLPKPPLPTLPTSLERYVDSLHAVLAVSASSQRQLESTKQIVSEFSRCDGPLLHRLVEKMAAEHDNWATHVWLPDMYLLNRTPLPVNQSAFFLFPRQSFDTARDQVFFAARLIKFALHFQRLIDTETLEQDFSRAIHARRAPMCMATYKNFFNSYRRPGVETDYQLSKRDNSSYTTCVIVIHRNQFYLLRADNDQSIDALTAALFKIRTSSSELSATIVAVGALTTLPRTSWADSYELLRLQNAALLEALEQCMMVLCLDEALPASFTGPSRAEQCESLLCGKGVSANSCNRWYDKTLQVIVGADGISGIIMEHSQSEGITLLRFMEMFLKDNTLKAQSVTNVNWDTAPTPTERLVWKISPCVDQALTLAKAELQKLVDDVDLYVLHFKEFGKEFPKSQKISPDVFVQLALQLTYFKVHHRLVSTYESASLRRYRNGRADNIRAASMEALRWVKAVCDESAESTAENKQDLFQSAVEKQTQILKYTVNGGAPDNHLLALRETANKLHKKCDMFEDESYKTFLNFKLSTSQLPNDSDIIVGYGAVVPDGYGCSYTIKPHEIVFCVTSFFSSSETSSDFFALSLEGSLNQMREHCLSNSGRLKTASATTPSKIHTNTAVQAAS